MLAEITLIAGAYFLGSVTHLSVLARLHNGNLDGEYHQMLRDKGSKALAMVFTLAWQPALIALVPVLIFLVFRTAPRIFIKTKDKQPIIGGAYSRSSPAGMFFCFLVLPLAAWWLNEPSTVIYVLTALCILMIIVRRLTTGLTTNIKSGNDVTGILINQMLFYRSTINWRQNCTVDVSTTGILII